MGDKFPDLSQQRVIVDIFMKSTGDRYIVKNLEDECPETILETIPNGRTVLIPFIEIVDHEQETVDEFYRLAALRNITIKIIS
tara:strand:- start:142406 stop:142654 length:249 start_codon:yes stop_codon:yes gene_type:complete